MKINNITCFAISVMMVVLLNNLVSAFAVSSPYWAERPLQMYPGDTYEFQLVLQNGGGAKEDITVKGELLDGGEVLEIIDEQETYFIPMNGRVDVNLRATIPSDAEIGKIYPVQLSFGTVTENKGGALGIGSGIKRSFNIEGIEPVKPPIEQVEEEELPETKPIATKIIMTIIIIVIIFAAIYFPLKKNKKGKRK